tara:strand:+ start:532 stop:684 length:153 start_codon:yes stop_codon:yes gene_type:complete
MAGVVELFPVLTFFNTLEIFVFIGIFFKQALYIIIVPVLAVIERQRYILS